jgi:hypothetical protein
MGCWWRKKQRKRTIGLVPIIPRDTAQYVFATRISYLNEDSAVGRSARHACLGFSEARSAQERQR